MDRREQTPLELVGIDEKAIRRGHRYATILTDLIGGNVIEVCEERTKQAAIRMLDSLPKALTETIEAVTMDMWPAYIGAVEQTLPEAVIVFDRFHIKQYLNKGVDLVRRQEHRQLGAAGAPSPLTGTKYQWLRTHDDMRLKCDIEFRQLLAQDLRTGTAWSLKEMFEHFWDYRSMAWALKFFHNWIDTVNESGLKPMMKVAETLRRHMAGIMNYIAYPITNASAEGMNSMIQGLRTAAKGLPVFANFRARILFHLGGLNLDPA
jgi:transposase